MAFKTPPPAPAPSIPELLAQLPEGSLDATDIACLKALKACMHTLRVDDASTGWLFTQDVRLYFAIEMNNALASVIKTRLPKAPARPVGRPRSEAKADEKAQAQAEKFNKKALILASNTFKVRIVNLIDALRACTTRAATLWDMKLDPVKRAERVAPAVQPVRAAFTALEEAVPDDEELTDAVNSMSANVTKFERAVTFWIDCPIPPVDKNDGLHKSLSISEWIDACRALARANTLYLQRVK